MLLLCTSTVALKAVSKDQSICLCDCSLVRHSHQENRGLNFCLKSARHLWLINQKMCVIATWIPPFSCHLHLLRRSKHSKHLIPGLWRRSPNYNMIDAILMAGINELLCMKRARQLGLLNQDFLPLFIFVAGI